MKKLFITMFVALLSMSTQAQEKGDFAVGLHAGATMTEFEFLNVKENTTQFGIGAFAQYNLSNHWRVELEGNYHPMKDHVSDFLLGLNVHYLINLTENFKIYPLLGYAAAFVHSETFTEGNATIEGDDDTDGGIQLGLGAQYNLNSNWFISCDYKYQPGLFGDSHVVMGGIGYRF